MVSSKEEFLLLARNWQNASATVGISIAFGGETSVNPLASAFVLKLNASVAEVNEAASNIAFSVGNTGFLSFGFEGATFNFGTSEDAPSILSSLLDAETEEVEESFTVGLKSGLVVTFLKFRPLSSGAPVSESPS